MHRVHFISTEENPTCKGNINGREERRIQGFSRETEGKIPLGKTTHRWDDNIKMGLQEVGVIPAGSG